MTNILTAIEDMAAASLLAIKDQNMISSPEIRQRVAKIAQTMSELHEEEISEADITIIAKRLEERFDISMEFGIILSSEEYRPWLDDSRSSIEWYYWDRYKRLLWRNRFPPRVINMMNSITDRILDHLENPKKSGKWSRRGMVVGHVQSGKTANYIGLICKAADSGYRVIIVLAGLINSLRNQTQERIDAGFIGMDSGRMLDDGPLIEKLTGVGLIDKERAPMSLTTSKQDFNTATARQISTRLSALNEPLVLVVKKHKGTLDNLIKWLKYNNPHNMIDYPMLLVDDEADLASINTSSDPDAATAINAKIRELLHTFVRSSYVGYTATPFANIFIDPDTDDNMFGDDLFPRDFIHSLDPPDNYIGPSKIFDDDAEFDIIRELPDTKDSFPIKHKIDFDPMELPPRLKEAIQCFILSRAIRISRGQNKAHNSMMINVSRFTRVQTKIRLLVEDYLKQLQHAVSNYSKLKETEALCNTEMACIKMVWENEFSDAGPIWSDIQGILKDAVSPIGVIEVNYSATAEPLDYSERNYPNGRNVIAVGGMSLSRGLTLEGLTISYFLRNSVMYDTLMQMGRWFGYRDGYSDLCRIYMTPEAASWYRHISEVLDELREEFKRMKYAGMSPKDFGLCVRCHPESLIVTARNKMRTGKKVLRQVNLEGRLVETSILFKDQSIMKQNMTAMKEMVFSANEYASNVPSPFGYLWKMVPEKYVISFVESFQNHPASQLTEKGPLTEYIKWLSSKNRGLWDVVLVSLKERDSGIELEVIPSFMVRTQIRRKVTGYPGNGIAMNKRRVASRGLEKAGLSDSEIQIVESDYGKENKPDHIYRNVEGRNPLLMLHILDCRENDDDKPMFENGIAAYGISFPGQAGSRRPEKLVEYMVNTVWWRNEHLDLIEEEVCDYE